jgi:glycosyltransferase involved in cell wall biosynthesis
MVTRLVRQIRKFNPDVIHFQLGHLWFNWALPILGDRPLVLTAHDSKIHLGDAGTQKIPQWVFDNACYRAQERIVHAPQIKESLLQRLDIPDETVHVVPHVLLGDDTAAEKTDGGEPVILFFGRIWKYKGLEYLIRAEPLITAKVPRVKIVISGLGEDFEQYRRMMVHPERFIVHNEYVSDEKRAELFRSASVVVLPYIEASQSGVIPIAYRFGKPVVATTVGGLPDMVDHGRTGYLVPPHDAQALAEAIIPILQSDALQSELGENGRRKINLECAPEVVGHKTRLVYRHAIQAQSATA